VCRGGTCSHTTACRAAMVKTSAADLLQSNAVVAPFSRAAHGAMVAEIREDLLLSNAAVSLSSLTWTTVIGVDGRPYNDGAAPGDDGVSGRSSAHPRFRKCGATSTSSSHNREIDNTSLWER